MMLFDTHCHLNFKAFAGRVGETIKKAQEAGVNYFLVPGTDIESSKKAVVLAEKFPEIYAAVGMHPHHVKQYQISNIPEPEQARFRTGKYQNDNKKIKNDLKQIEELLKHPKVVAIGEVGLDRHKYQKTKYEDYQINDNFLRLQKILFKEQIKLAIKYKKSLIIHSREAVGETLEIIGEPSTLNPLTGRMVFHCCEAQKLLLEFALAHQIYIGVDGDVTYNQKKQEFIKKVPFELLVLETDAPFLLPEPLRSEKKQVNEPKNLSIIAQFIADLKKVAVKKIHELTTKNAKRLFQII